ncbi:helix-turn-helix domain-containing protein [Dehalococcoides mccartyi]
MGISHQTIYNLIKKGLPSYKLGSKRVFIKEDLMNWVKSQKSTP